MVKLKKAGAIMMIAIGIIICAVTTVALILWNRDDLLTYTGYFVLGSSILYFLGALFIFGGKVNLKIRSESRTRVVAFFVVMLTLFSFVTGGTIYLAWDEFVPKPYMLYPREYAILIDPGYKFSTAFGGLNQTTEYFLDALWDTNSYLYPDAYAWGESYIERGMVHMYLSTGNTTILEHVIERMEVVLNNSDLNGDGVPGYGTDKYHLDWMQAHNVSRIEFIVWDGMILLPLAEVALIIKNNATLAANASLASFAEQVIQTSEAVIQRWNETNWHEEGDAGYYLSPPFNTSAIFNRIHALGRLMIKVHEYTGNQTYLDQVTKIARFFKEHLVTRQYTMDGGQYEMYTWGYDWTSDNSDTSHGSIDVDFVVMCHERGIVFDLVDMERFANTFVDFVYRGPLEKTRAEECDSSGNCVNHSNVYADNVNGWTGSANHYRTLRQGFMQLYRYYRNTTISSYVVFKSIDDLIDGGLYSTSTLFQKLAFIREMAYVAREFPVNWF